MQRNTGVTARALAHTQLVDHIGAGVDTTRYLFAERGRKKRAEGRKVRGDGKRLGAESPRCVGDHPSFFPAFYLFTRASTSVLLPPLSDTLLRIFFSPALHQADAWEPRPLPSVTRRKRRLSRRLSLAERRVHTFVVVSNTRKAIFSQSGICDILRRFYVSLLRWQKTSFLLTWRLNRLINSFKFITLFWHFKFCYSFNLSLFHCLENRILFCFQSI